jgi:hypothetical protein
VNAVVLHDKGAEAFELTDTEWVRVKAPLHHRGGEDEDFPFYFLTASLPHFDLILFICLSHSFSSNFRLLRSLREHRTFSPSVSSVMVMVPAPEPMG